MHVNPTAYRDFHHTRISLLKSSAFFDFNLAKSETDENESTSFSVAKNSMTNKGLCNVRRTKLNAQVFKIVKQKHTKDCSVMCLIGNLSFLSGHFTLESAD